MLFFIVFITLCEWYDNILSEYKSDTPYSTRLICFESSLLNYGQMRG